MQFIISNARKDNSETERLEVYLCVEAQYILTEETSK